MGNKIGNGYVFEIKENFYLWFRYDNFFFPPPVSVSFIIGSTNKILFGLWFGGKKASKIYAIEQASKQRMMKIIRTKYVLYVSSECVFPPLQFYYFIFPLHLLSIELLNKYPHLNGSARVAIYSIRVSIASNISWYFKKKIILTKIMLPILMHCNIETVLSQMFFFSIESASGVSNTFRVLVQKKMNSKNNSICIYKHIVANYF